MAGEISGTGPLVSTKKSKNGSQTMRALTESVGARSGQTGAYNIVRISTEIFVTDPMQAIINYDSIIKSSLESDFRGKCYQGQFIEEIIAIITSSDIVMSRFHENVIGTIAVVFDARIVQLNPGDLILARITNVANGIHLMISHSDNIKVVVQNEPSFEAKVGDWVVVVAKEIEYEAKSTAISCLAEWFKSLKYIIRNCVGETINFQPFSAPMKPAILPGESTIPSAAKKLDGQLKAGVWAFWFKGDGTVYYSGISESSSIHPPTKIPVHSILVSQGNMVDMINRMRLIESDAPHIKRLLAHPS